MNISPLKVVRNDLSFLEENKVPDLFLLDIIMLEMSGWEVCDKLRDNLSFRNNHIAYLTDRIVENA